MQKQHSPTQREIKAQALPAAPLFGRRFVIATLSLGFAAALCVQALSTQAQSSVEDAQSKQADASKSESEAASAAPVSVEKDTARPVKKSPPSIKAQSAQSADNYEATEEISEDLSVSYPVDI